MVQAIGRLKFSLLNSPIINLKKGPDLSGSFLYKFYHQKNGQSLAEHSFTIKCRLTYDNWLNILELYVLKEKPTINSMIF